MGNCYPSRINKTGNKEISICEKCANRINIKFIKLEPFWHDNILEVSKQIEDRQILRREQPCIYLDVMQHDFYKMLILECNQFKPLINNIMNNNYKNFLDMGFIMWIRKFGDEEDKICLQGSGFPTVRDRESSKRAYERYTKWLENKSIEQIQRKFKI